MSSPHLSPATKNALSRCLALGLAFAGLLLPPGSDGVPTRPAEALALNDYAGGDPRDERTSMPEIFVGQVIARDGEIDIGDEEPFIVPMYEVNVATSLKGEARGRVRLSVADTGLLEATGGSRVVVGGRYLFFAYRPNEGDGSYAISEGLGSLKIADGEDGRNTIALFERLIEETEHRPAEHEVDSCQRSD